MHPRDNRFTQAAVCFELGHWSWTQLSVLDSLARPSLAAEEDEEDEEPVAASADAAARAATAAVSTSATRGACSRLLTYVVSLRRVLSATAGPAEDPEELANSAAAAEDEELPLPAAGVPAPFVERRSVFLSRLHPCAAAAASVSASDKPIVVDMLATEMALYASPSSCKSCSRTCPAVAAMPRFTEDEASAAAAAAKNPDQLESHKSLASSQHVHTSRKALTSAVARRHTNLAPSLRCVSVMTAARIAKQSRTILPCGNIFGWNYPLESFGCAGSSKQSVHESLSSQASGVDLSQDHCSSHYGLGTGHSAGEISLQVTFISRSEADSVNHHGCQV